MVLCFPKLAWTWQIWGILNDRKVLNGSILCILDAQTFIFLVLVEVPSVRIGSYVGAENEAFAGLHRQRVPERSHLPANGGAILHKLSEADIGWAPDVDFHGFLIPPLTAQLRLTQSKEAAARKLVT